MAHLEFCSRCAGHLDILLLDYLRIFDAVVVLVRKQNVRTQKSVFIQC